MSRKNSLSCIMSKTSAADRAPFIAFYFKPAEREQTKIIIESIKY